MAEQQVEMEETSPEPDGATKTKASKVPLKKKIILSRILCKAGCIMGNLYHGFQKSCDATIPQAFHYE